MHRFLLFTLVISGAAFSQDLRFQSAYLRVEMTAQQPGFSVLAVDSLGKNKLDFNAMQPAPEAVAGFQPARSGQIIEYRAAGAADPAWAFAFGERRITIRSSYSKQHPPKPLLLNFNSILCHPTLLGLFNGDGALRLPALLHIPDHGTFRITTAAKGLALGYASRRDESATENAATFSGGDKNFVRVTFPPATAGQPRIEYTLDVVAIYPPAKGIADDRRYDGYRRNFLNILQLNPRLRVLANHAASDPCAFTVYEYSAVAVKAPPLADGLSALDILRQSLDRYTSGMVAYGMPFYEGDKKVPYDFLDTYPSLVMAASDYVMASKDKAWLDKNYPALKRWAGKMIEFDRDGDGFMEYPLSGNSGSWPVELKVRPSNWWDTIGFGHKDAYSNALAYRAFGDMAEMARMLGRTSDAELYDGRARKLKAAYYKTFYNPATGVLAGWKSADGKLHDYYFLFVNGMAVTYGLVTPEQGNQIWDKLLAKMKQVGYHRFDLGLPGNLIPVRREDYVTPEHRWGGSKRADGSDGFQIYENGGASGNFAYFTLAALRKLGRNAEADAILYPMLQAFENGGFQGRGSNGLTYDWKTWDGTPRGYEGFLVDNYMTLLAAMPR
jgi:hypothetical protein